MIDSGQVKPVVPLVHWQGREDQLFRLIRLDELKGKRPRDGHDPGVPHRIGFHAIMLVEEGVFKHWIDFQTHEFQKDQLIYIAPNKIHKFVKREHEHLVWALIFRPELFPAGLQQFHGSQASWSVVSYIWPQSTVLQPTESATLLEQFQFLRRMESDLVDGFNACSVHFVRGIIELAFEFSRRNQIQPTDTTASNRFLRFVQLLEEHFDSRREIKWYAEQLDCSQRTLNRACEHTTGETAKRLLTRRVIIEAKRLLTQSGDSVNSVGLQLGFAETTNFVRYFRSEVGMTPQGFRESHR